MISFKEFIQEDVTDEEIDALIESIEWEDIIDMYDENELVVEAISAQERAKKGHDTLRKYLHNLMKLH